MYRLREFGEAELLDMLTKYTTHYTHMLNNNDKSDAFYECKRMIEKITEEITSRRQEASSKDRNRLFNNPDQF